MKYPTSPLSTARALLPVSVLRASAAHTAIALLCALLASSPAVAAPPKKAASQEPITLNFVNADIESVARALATASHRNLVVDPRVKGTLNLSTDEPVAPAEAWNQFLAVLRLQGFAVVESHGLYKVVPEADAKLQGGDVQAIDKNKGPATGGQIVTQIFRLNQEQAANLVPVLRPLISANNTINVNPGTNALVITDYADNLQRIGRIIAALDVANASDVEIIPLKNAVAIDLAPLVLRLIESGSSAASGQQQGQTDTGYRTTLLAEPRSNALIVRAANPARVTLVRSLVEKLDQPGSQNPGGNIHVVYLRNAEATKLAGTLRAALAATASTTGTTTGTTTTGSTATATQSSTPNTSTTSSSMSNGLGTTGSASLSGSSGTANNTGGQIQADAATNSLIISAPEPQYRQLRAVIDQLDQRRAQVLVESLIAEVDATKAAQMGIQWQGASSTSSGGATIFGTNFNNGLSTTASTGNILSASSSSTAVSALGNGLNIGTVRNINGTYVLGSLATFLQQNADANILSTPTLLTLDNEEAKIVVGQNVPFVTGQYTTSNTTSSTVNPFQTIERKDVGLTLKVKPQISETGTVKLTIYQEVSSIDTSTTSTAGIITNKRSIESNVLVDDGSVVVLGGLLSDEYSGSGSQVPGVGDIPILGWLFKSEARTRKKSNLMVFLRPLVIRDAAASDALSGSRYQQMMGLQQSVQPSTNPLLNVTGSGPVMAPPPAPKAPAASDTGAAPAMASEPAAPASGAVPAAPAASNTPAPNVKP